MIDRKRLLAIPQIKLAALEITTMSNDQLTAYVQLLAKFTETVPDQEEALKLAMENLDYVSYMQGLATIWDMLVKIRADDLAESCLKQIDGVKNLVNEKNVDNEKITAEMTRFLTALSTLSIDIQMALYQWAPTAPKEPQQKAPPAQQALSGTEKIILAVDDSPFFLTTLKRCLKDVTYKLVCLTSGDAALRFLTDHDPALFILDIEMPNMNGHELALKIRKSGHQAPLIFLTGNATEKNVRKALEAGAADFIVKPIDDTFVLNKISKYIKI